MIYRLSLLWMALLVPILSACGGGTDTPQPVAAARLCPESVDYNTVFTGGSGAGELVQIQIDTAALTYRVTYLDSPVPVALGTVSPTRAERPYNVVTGTLERETLLPTASRNRCAFRLSGASLSAAHPARVFLGDGVIGGTIPGAEIAFDGVAGIGVVPRTTFPYYPFIGFAQQETNLAAIAGDYTMLGYRKVPSRNFQPVALDASMTLQADGAFSQCDRLGPHAGTCRQPGMNFVLRSDSPAFESRGFDSQLAPTQALDGPQARGILIAGKLRGQLVPVLVRVGKADASIAAPPGAPPKTPVADDESGIALLARTAAIASGVPNGEYVGVGSDFAYRAMALIGAQATLLDPFNPSQASLASALDLDFAQRTPGVVAVSRASAKGGSAASGKMIFAGGTFAYLDSAGETEPYFIMGAFVQ